VGSGRFSGFHLGIGFGLNYTLEVCAAPFLGLDADRPDVLGPKAARLRFVHASDLLGNISGDPL